MGMATAGLISGALSIVSGIFGASAASKRESAARKEKEIAQRKLTFLENNRQEIINPYEGVKDLSGLISNPMANLAVATQAAKMQVEQADISLANTLDTIRSTGAGAGGATALAQAALASKKDVSANIEQQEAQNERLRAQGEQQLQQLKMSEQQRMQQADVSGKSFMFNTQEDRDKTQLNRLSAQVSGAAAAEAQAGADKTGAITGAIGGVMSTVGSMYNAGAFKGSPVAPPPPEKGMFDDMDYKQTFGIKP